MPTFTFATALNSGASYAVTVFTQPSSPAQNCVVTNGSGTATANVTSVMVDCSHGEWTWESGSSTPSQPGVYAPPGSSSLVPGARLVGTISWTDTAGGNLWLFGGIGLDSAGTNAPSGGDLNDLWKYNIANNTWTFVSGSTTITFNTATPPAQTGPIGVYSGTPIPGGRDSGVSWIDSSGNLWLFGGQGLDSAGNFGDLNDLWEYTVSSGQWTFKSGSMTRNANGVYAPPGLVPGARINPVSWADTSGNLWLFGGIGLDSTSTTAGFLNDLWKYSIANGAWTFVGGSSTTNANGA